MCHFFKFLPEDMSLLILEGGEERERETSIGCLPYVPRPGIKPVTFGLWDDAPTELPGQDAHEPLLNQPNSQLFL